MPRKPFRMYKQIRGQAYTRKEYMGGVPNIRIANFNVGDARADFPVELVMVSRELCQVRHNALEAARVAATRVLTKTGPMSFHLKILVYPHIVLRENKIATGAGADRVSQGMRAAFGKGVGLAARIKPGTKLILIRTTPQYYPQAKEAMRKARMKMPTPTRIVVQKGRELLNA